MLLLLLYTLPYIYTVYKTMKARIIPIRAAVKDGLLAFLLFNDLLVLISSQLLG